MYFTRYNLLLCTRVDILHLVMFIFLVNEWTHSRIRGSLDSGKPQHTSKGYQIFCLPKCSHGDDGVPESGRN